MTIDLPDVTRPDQLTDALRRHGVLSAGRVRDVTTDAPRDTQMSRIVRLKLAYEGTAEKAPASLILKTWRPREGVPEAWAAREMLFYDTVAPATPAGLLLRCFDAGQSPQTKAWHLLLEDVMMAMHWYPERRRRFERPLLDHYHASLLASGVKGYDRAMLDHDYRLAVLIQMMTPIIWASIGIPPAVWWNNFERIMLAVEDLGCRELLA